MNEKTTNPGYTYQIRIKGKLSQSLAGNLENIIMITQERNETLLVGKFPDQPALRGLLDQLWNLNFTVLSVEWIETQT